MEEKNHHRNFIHIASGSWVGKIAKTGIEMIPSPVGYGPGDMLSAANAITGKDLLSGEHLDRTERVIHDIAAIIPLVPAAPFVEIVRMIRHRAEEAAHAKRQGQHAEALRHTANAHGKA